MDRLWDAQGRSSRLPIHQRRSILKRGLIGAGLAFVIGVLAITVVEYGIGNSLSCGIWSNCPATSAPGFNGGNAYTAGGARTGHSILANRSAGGGVNQQIPQQTGGGLFERVQPAPQQQVQPQGGGGPFGGGNQQPVQPTPAEPTPAEPVAPETPEVPETPQ